MWLEVWFDWFSSRIELETDDSHESQTDNPFITSISSIAITDTFSTSKLKSIPVTSSHVTDFQKCSLVRWFHFFEQKLKISPKRWSKIGSQLCPPLLLNLYQEMHVRFQFKNQRFLHKLNRFLISQYASIRASWKWFSENLIEEQALTIF